MRRNVVVSSFKDHRLWMRNRHDCKESCQLFFIEPTTDTLLQEKWPALAANKKYVRIIAHAKISCSLKIASAKRYLRVNAPASPDCTDTACLTSIAMRVQNRARSWVMQHFADYSTGLTGCYGPVRTQGTGRSKSRCYFGLVAAGFTTRLQTFLSDTGGI